MQIKLILRPERQLIIPFNYFYQLQSSLYNLLGEVGASDFWHDNGFGDSTKFKGFCFSGLEGRYKVDKENKKLIFDRDVSLEIRSPKYEFIDSFQRALEIHPYIKLYDTSLDAVSASLENRHLMSGNVILRATTPVVVHQTASDGHTYFFSPEEDEFYDRICLNAAKKYETITGGQADDITIWASGSYKKTVTVYKNFIINGYTGDFELETSLRMAEFIYNTGLGEKNSQGFGFVKTD